MKKFTIYAGMIAAVLAMLAACGGGGGDSTPTASSAPVVNASDKYVGTWGNCQASTNPANGLASVRIDIVFTKTTGTSMSLVMNGAGFSVPNCVATNQVSSTPSLATGTMTIDGSKVAGADTVDLLSVVFASATAPALNTSGKDIGLVSGNSLKFSATSVADAQGYPTVIDNALVFTKR